MWLLLNSAGRCSATCDHTGSRRRPKRRAPQRVVGVLQLLDGLGVPPDHQVGVGAQAAQVVEPADDDVVGLELGEQLLDLARLGVAVGVLAQHVAQAEHRPHRVADGVVELARLLRRWLVMAPLLGKWPVSRSAHHLGGRQVGRGDAGRDPDAVVRRAADRQPGQLGRARAGRRRPGRGGRRRTAAARRPTAGRGCRPAARTARSRRRGRAGRARPAPRR